MAVKGGVDLGSKSVKVGKSVKKIHFSDKNLFSNDDKCSKMLWKVIFADLKANVKQ